MIHNLYKQRGETPLERIHRFRNGNPKFKDEKFTYLGRLDPMAEGLLLVASGPARHASRGERGVAGRDDLKRKEEFLGLDKEYEFVALFGFATDTYDCLGKIVRVEKLQNLDENEVRKVAMIYEGEREQKYPPYSSKIQKWNSPDDDVDGVEIPSKNINIYKMEFLGLQTLSAKELFGRLLMDISKVKGDFRQNEILITWKKILEGMISNNSGDNKIFLGNFKASVSTGTYIRGIVNDLGNTLGTGACALSIKRTKLGDYKIEDSLK